MTSLCRADIEALLPHRGEALFLLDATVVGAHVEGHACWSGKHPHLAGHFPQMPVVPGVFLIEAAAQLAGLVLALRGSDASSTCLGMLAGVKRSLIHHPVYPEERVRFELDINPGIGSRMATAHGTAHKESGRKVLTIEVTLAMVERSEVGQSTVNA